MSAQRLLLARQSRTKPTNLRRVEARGWLPSAKRWTTPAPSSTPSRRQREPSKKAARKEREAKERAEQEAKDAEERAELDKLRSGEAQEAGERGRTEQDRFDLREKIVAIVEATNDEQTLGEIFAAVAYLTSNERKDE